MDDEQKIIAKLIMILVAGGLLLWRRSRRMQAVLNEEFVPRDAGGHPLVGGWAPLPSAESHGGLHGHWCFEVRVKDILPSWGQLYLSHEEETRGDPAVARALFGPDIEGTLPPGWALTSDVPDLLVRNDAKVHARDEPSGEREDVFVFASDLVRAAQENAPKRADRLFEAAEGGSAKAIVVLGKHFADDARLPAACAVWAQSSDPDVRAAAERFAPSDPDRAT